MIKQTTHSSQNIQFYHRGLNTELTGAEWGLDYIRGMSCSFHGDQLITDIIIILNFLKASVTRPFMTRPAGPSTNEKIASTTFSATKERGCEEDKS